MSYPPMFEQSIPKRQFRKFREWLAGCGGQLEPSTNPYEVLRVRTDTEVLILYKKANGALNWPTRLAEYWNTFKDGRHVKLTASTKRKRSSSKVRAILDRDGRECFFCGVEMIAGEETIEHLVPVAHGGPNHISNLVLACGPSQNDCNRKAGHRSAAEKVRLRDQLRAQYERR